jgi:hypothetical protein
MFIRRADVRIIAQRDIEVLRRCKAVDIGANLDWDNWDKGRVWRIEAAEAYSISGWSIRECCRRGIVSDYTQGRYGMVIPAGSSMYPEVATMIK